MSRTRRTAQELIEEQEQRLEKLREKASLEQAKQSPELASIVDAIKQETAAITEAQRGLGSGQQSLQSRLQKHHAWIEEISKAERLAEIVLESSTERKNYLSDSLTTLSESLANGDDISVDILETLASMPSSTELEDAQFTYEAAHSYRKSLSSTQKDSSNAESE